MNQFLVAMLENFPHCFVDQCSLRPDSQPHTGENHVNRIVYEMKLLLAPNILTVSGRITAYWNYGINKKWHVVG